MSPVATTKIYVKIATRTCPICHQQGSVENVNLAGYLEYTHGTHIQNALPDLSPDQREQIISGCHKDCFNKTFKDSDE